MTKREIRLEGGAPWGFRMNGGADSGHPLRISRVNPGSKAAQQGVREGDVISAINGTTTRLLTNGDSHALLKSAGPSLTLGLNQDNTSSPKRRSREINKRDNPAGDSQDLGRLNDDHVIGAQKSGVSASTLSSSSSSNTTADLSLSKKQGKKSKARRAEEEEEKEANTAKVECDEVQTEEVTDKNDDQSVENGKKISSSKARRLRKLRSKRKIITSDHLEITIIENNCVLSDTVAFNNNSVKDSICDIVVSNDDDNLDDKSITSSNSNVDRKVVQSDEMLNSDKDHASSNEVFNIDKQHVSLPAIDISQNTLISTDNISTNTCESNSANSTTEGQTPAEKSEKIKKKSSKKSKPRPLNLEYVECSMSSSDGCRIDSRIENSPGSEMHLEKTEINTVETVNKVNRGTLASNETDIEKEIEIEITPLSINESSLSVITIDDKALGITQPSQDSTMSSSIPKKKKKTKSKTPKSDILEISEQIKSSNTPSEPVENENMAVKDVDNGSTVEKNSLISSSSGFGVENVKNDRRSKNVAGSEEYGASKKNKKSYMKSILRREEEVPVDDSNRNYNSNLDSINGGRNIRGDRNSNFDEGKLDTAAVELTSDISDQDKPNTASVELSSDISEHIDSLSRSDYHFLHIESSTSSVFNEEVDTDCLRMSSLSRDQVRSPVELVLNPPTPTLADQGTFFGPDWETVEEMDATDSASSKRDTCKEVSVHDSSNSDLRAEVNNLLVVEDCVDDLGLTVEDIRTPIIPPEEEKKLRSFLETLDLVKPDTEDDDYYPSTSGDAKEEIVVYRHCTRRSSAEACYIPPPHRHYLDVITEENSDLSDNDRKSDCDKPWENPELIKKNNDIDEIPDDWGDSDQEAEYPSGEDGGIKPWNGGTTLEEVEGIEIVYLDSDNSDETIVEHHSDAILEKNEPKLLVCKTGEMGSRHKIDSSLISNASGSEDYENQEEKSNIDNNFVSKVIIKEKEFGRKTHIDLIETIPKSGKPVLSCDGENNNSRIIESVFHEKCNQTKSNEEVVNFTVPSALHADLKILNDENECTIDKDSIGIEFVRENRNPKKCETVESKNYKNNLETLDLIKVYAKSDGEDRSDSENIYEYIEFRHGNDDKIKDEKVKEIDQSVEDNEVKIPKPQVTVDVTSTPILSRQNSSSSGTLTTQSTSKYNQSPTAWSSENEEKPDKKPSSHVDRSLIGKDPESLRELSTKKVISLPNGLKLLEDIGILQFRRCSGLSDGCNDEQNEYLNFQNHFSGRSSTFLDSPDLTCPPLSVSASCFRNRYSLSPKSCSIFYTPPRSLVNSPPCSLPPDRERWIGIPTASQNTFVCFSPSQSKISPLPPGPQEAAGLLDLHKKFIERRGYHEDRWRDSSSDLQSPDLIRLEQYSVPTKQRDYTPELLAEAANLLALKEYRESRCNEVRSPDFETCEGVVRSVLKKFKIDEARGYVGVEHDENSNNFNDVSKILTKSFNEDVNTLNDLLKELENVELVNDRRSKSIKHSVTAPMKEISGLYENLKFEEREKSGRGVVRDKLGELENDSIRVGLGEESDGSRLLALIQSEKDLPAKLQVAAASNCDSCCNGSVMTRGDSSRGDSSTRVFDADDYKISKRGDIAVVMAVEERTTKRGAERPKSLPPAGSGTELFRQKMYEEYMEQVAERHERRQHKVIRLSGRPASLHGDDPTTNEVHNLEDEFMVKVRERMSKLGINLEDNNNEVEDEEVEDVLLPKHLQEFAQLAHQVNSHPDGGALPSLVEEVDGALIYSRGFLTGKRGVWSPAATPEAQRKVFDVSSAEKEQREEAEDREDNSGSPPPVVWSPKSVPSPTVERKSYRPVKFESPPPVRKNIQKPKEDSPKPPTSLPLTPSDWSKQQTSTRTSSTYHQSESSEQRLTSSQSADSSLAFSSEVNLPRAPNPTITLLQKAREGQLPRGAHYLEGEEGTASIASDDRRPHIVPNEIIYTVKKEYCSEGEDRKPKKIVELGPRKFEGIGPTTKEGIPIVLRSEVKDTNQQKWYKRMYDSLHKAEADKYVTVRYRSNKKDQYPYASAAGYLSEPDRLGYDSDLTSSKYATLDRRRIRNKEKDFTTSTMPRSKYVPDNSIKKPVDVYKNQPGRIEDYEPGRSSISEKEAKQWWDEVLDIFDEQFEQAQNTSRPPATTPNTGKPFMTYALKESGYESDSTLVFKRRDENLQNQLAMSPAEQKMAYKTIQKGGEVPLHGLRKPAPERPKDDSDLEYFPISPHLTRIRIHKSKQIIKPIREIICYPITSITTDNPPPVFSTFKRTARPSVSLSRSRSPEREKSPHRPPSPPKRRSSRSNSTLRLYSKISTPSTHLSRTSSGLEVDSNVQYLKERITNKLSRKAEYPSSRITKSNSSTTRRESPSPGVRSPSSASVRSMVPTTSRKIIERKSLPSTLRSRKDLSTSKLNISPDLRAPAEVKKALKDRETKEKANVSYNSGKEFPPGTLVKSSTTFYSSARDGKKSKEDKALRVTVAISAKGRELLRSPSIPRTSPAKENGYTSPKRPETPLKRSDRDVKSPSPSSIKSSSSKTKITASSENLNRQKETAQSSKVKTLSGKTSPISAVSTDQSKKLKKSAASPDITKKKKDKNISSVSKPISMLKSLTSRKTSNDKGSKDQNGKKKSKKKAEETSQEDGSPKKAKKTVSKTKTKEKENEGERKNQSECGESSALSKSPAMTNSVENLDNDLMLDPVTDSKALQPLRSDSFFQHLFLRDTSSSPTPSYVSSICNPSTVLERARKFCETGEGRRPRMSFKSEPSLKLLSVYLNHKKPVTESKFRSLDKDIVSGRSSRSLSPYYCRGRSFEFFERLDKFDRMNNIWDKANSVILSPTISRNSSPACESVKERSSSEPPPGSPPSYDNHHQYWDADETVSPSLSRSPSCRRIRNARTMTRTIESIGGLKRKGVRAKSVGDGDNKKPLSPLHAQSTSSLNLSHAADHNDYQGYFIELLHSTKKSDRFRELHKFYSSLERMGQLERTTSNSDLRPRMKGEEVIDYDRWKGLRTKERAEEELKILYEKLKEDQKEKGLLFRPREPEAFRWRREQDMGLRNREKSVEDLKNQYYRLTAEDSDFDEQKRKEFDMKKDVYKPLWRGSSVVNLAHSLTTSVASHRGRPVSISEHSFHTTRPIAQKYTRSIGSRLWSSLSMEQVNALKSQLSEIYSTVSNLKRERINRMIEGTKERKPKEDYEISVPPGDITPSSSSDVLHVRCNSLLSSEQLYSPLTRKKEARRSEVVKADSISSIPQLKESKSGSSGESQASSVITKPLTENEKRRLSMTLSQEVLDRVGKKDEKRKKKRNSASLVIPRETLGAVAAIKGNKKIMLKKSPTTSETNSPRTCYSIEMSEDSCPEKTSLSSPKSKNNFLLVLTPKDDNAQELRKVVDKWANTTLQHNSRAQDEHIEDSQVTARLVQTSNSETDSGSSEASTVIHLGSRESMLKKDETKSGKIETLRDKNRVSRSDGDVSFSHQNPTKRACSAPGVFDVTESEISQTPKIPKLSSSQSFTDLKELFGEQKATIYTVPKQPAAVQVTDLDEDTDVKCQLSPITSDQLSARSRSISPDPMRYYRAYLSMVKAGDVRKLREKFESLEDLYHGQNIIQMQATLKSVKKFQSDPDLTREYFSRCSADPNKTVVKGQELGDVQWLKSRYEKDFKHRSRQRSRRVVSPVPLRAEDRFMPHINVISKMAALQQQKRSSTAPARPDMIYKTGEVDRIRQQFEEKQNELSLLGQMYTSTPDVRELRDIAPYLECQWIAHQHPKPRSLSSPETQRSAPRSPKMRPSSASPTRSYTSILKPRQGRWHHRDPFANQLFDPSIHRPLYRYQPPPPLATVAPAASRHHRPWRADPNWWWRNIYASAKPSVTFQEPISGGPVPVPERSHLPKRQSESPHRYVESEVTIHYKSPVRSEAKEALSEEELAQRQAETMRRIYQEERRRKYLQELQDMYSRRHTDNFIPSQKSPIPLNRYDDFPNDVGSTLKSRDRTPEPKLVARALYNFVGQSSRELTFRRGDIIYVRRQIDKNWFEGEHNAMIGLFPLNHVEIIPYDGIRTMPKRSSEGQARAKFNFQAQTHLELSLVKGELVVLTRRVDENWFEGKIGNRKGIFPVSYVEVLVEPGERAVSPVRPTTPASNKPVASPASHSMILNGARNSLSHHHYTPPPPVSYTSLSRPTKTSKQDLPPVNQALHIDTQSEPVPYRALYNYKPQNDDELELEEGDVVFVMEKCDDGWYVGSSQRSACFGTFPGNYVQRLPRVVANWMPFLPETLTSARE